MTINLPRIGYLSKTEEELFERIRQMANYGRYRSRQEKIIEYQSDMKLYPYSSYYLRNVKRERDSIGIIILIR